jgi:hypothetical protein
METTLAPIPTYGLGNQITSYKERILDLSQPVQIYRRLRGKGVSYSLKQKGLVMAHATRVLLRDVTFEVNEKGRQWVIANKHKVPHAYVNGLICLQGAMGQTAEQDLPARVTYNPYKAGSFVYQQTGNPIKGAWAACLNEHGVTISYGY